MGRGTRGPWGPGGGPTHRGRLLVGPQRGQAVGQDGAVADADAHGGAAHTLDGGRCRVRQRAQHHTLLAALRVRVHRGALAAVEGAVRWGAQGQSSEQTPPQPHGRRNADVTSPGPPSRKCVSFQTIDPRMAGGGGTVTHPETPWRPIPPRLVSGASPTSATIAGGSLTQSSEGSPAASTPATNRDLTRPPPEPGEGELSELLGG